MLTGAVTSVLLFLASFQCLITAALSVLNCDFEGASTCGWDSTRGPWQRVKSGTLYPTGPMQDHTTGNGSYMAITIESVGGAFTSPIVNSVSGGCLTFWYYMYGFEVDTLTVYKTVGKAGQQELFQVSGNQGQKWHKAVVNTGNGTFKLQIVASNRIGNQYGNIAIDDISVSLGAECVKDVARSDTPVFDCDFEKDLCFWAFPHRELSQWGAGRMTVSPEDVTTRTFPPDNTGNSFLKIERVHSYFHQTVLIAPAIPIGKDGACLSFWHKPYEPFYDVVRFAIKKSVISSKFQGHSQEGEILLELINARKREWSNPGIWNFAQVNLPPGNDYFIFFHVFFDSWRDDRSYILIDDIKLDEEGPCKPVPQNKKINCDFEKDFCRWVDPNDWDGKHLDWIRRRGPTPTPDTGPSGDHTTGDGYYIHFKDPPARIKSPPVKISPTGACLTFWYHMYGEDVKTLTLTGRRESVGTTGLWMQEGNQGDQWLQQNVSIVYEGDISFTFSVTKGYFPRADIALDDISISFDGVCDKDRPTDITTTEPTPETSVITTSKVKKWLPAPVLTINGDIKPALINSRVEILCGDQLDGAKYTWLKKDEHEFNAMVGQEERTLLFDDIRDHHEGTYMCSVAREGYLTAESKTFHIEVVWPRLSKPVVTVKGMANPVYEDSKIELDCQSPDNDTDPSYEWNKFQGTERRSLSETSQKLVFDEIQVRETANYSCTVRKEGYLPAESEIVEIIVVKDPRPSPRLHVNVEGSLNQVHERIVFRCGDEDVERGVFHWKTDSAAFATSPPSNNRNFVIEKSDPSHSGNYSCRISKDGYFTAKSRTVNLKFVPGKHCTSRYSCWGDSHSGKCVNNRCECDRNAVLLGNKCVERPRKPIIQVSPDYRKFDHGETFYLICKVQEPLKSLTYQFKKSSRALVRDGVLETYYIHRVADAKSSDSGTYACAVNQNGLESYYSDSVSIDVKEFEDLNCDFENQDTCSWMHVDEPHAINFTIEDEYSNSVKSHKGNLNSYLQMPPSMDKLVHSAYLRSPKIDFTNLESCLSFRYRMHGPEVYSLAVWKYSKLWQDFPQGQILWTAIGDQGDKWVKKKLTIERHGNIYLQFEAVGDVDIDDIQYRYRGNCFDHY